MNRKPQLSNKQQGRLADLAAESARRATEGLRIFRPLPYQMPFFLSTASEYLVRGGNRSGKTYCVAAEVASAATGIPITGPDDKPLPFKYPTDRPLLIWLIGYGETHIGDTFHRMLFRRNPEFKMIRDRETNRWRAFRPWEEEDAARVKEARMTPPMIPARMLASKEPWAWKDKAKRHFTICRLSNGTELHAFTSKGEPKMGDPVDLIWVDERIMFSRHYAEWQARISDRKGRIIWSSWPGYGNAALIDLIRRAKREKKREKPDVEEIRFRFSDNPFIDAEEKAKRIRGWSPDERMSRDEGQLIEGRGRVYPSFSQLVHSTPCEDKAMDDKVDEILRKTNGVPPHTWRRDLILDPGHAYPGVLFCAIPPPKFGDCGVVYDEVFLPQSDAEMLAAACSSKMQGVAFESFWIDAHASAQTPMGFSKTVMEQYSNAFARHRLSSRMTGSNFQWGSDDIEAGLGLVRAKLMVRPNGRPWLRVVASACPNFVQQMELYEKAKDAHGYIIDKPAPRQVDPLCDCVRYWVSSDPQYVIPDRPAPPPGVAYTVFHEEWKKKDPEDSSMSVGAGAIA